MGPRSIRDEDGTPSGSRRRGGPIAAGRPHSPRSRLIHVWITYFTHEMNALLQAGRIPILLALREGRPRRSINELARNAGVPVATCWRAVQDLKHLGLVLIEKHGNVSLVSLNPSSPAVPRLLALQIPDPHRMAFESFERRLLRRLPKLRVRLFGSVARGQHSPESDVDVLVEYQGAGYPRRLVERAAFDCVEEVTDEFLIAVVPMIVAKDTRSV